MKPGLTLAWRAVRGETPGAMFTRTWASMISLEPLSGHVVAQCCAPAPRPPDSTAPASPTTLCAPSPYAWPSRALRVGGRVVRRSRRDCSARMSDAHLTVHLQDRARAGAVDDAVGAEPTEHHRESCRSSSCVSGMEATSTSADSSTDRVSNRRGLSLHPASGQRSSAPSIGVGTPTCT